MILTGAVALGGTLVLGNLARQRRRQAKAPLIATLHPTEAGSPIAMARAPRWANRSRLIALGGLAAGGSALLLAGTYGYTPLVLARQLALTLQRSRYGPLLYIAADTIRPLTFFPDSLMTLISGLIFGPVQGLLISYIGFGTSALLAYGVGRALRGRHSTMTPLATIDPVPAEDATQESFTNYTGIRPLLNRFGTKMQEQPFLSMVLMHGMFLHADTVNALAGYLGLGIRPFLTGAMIGVIPAMTANVLAGASLHNTVATGVLHFNPLLLAASGVLLISSFGVATYIQKRNVIESA